jgi:predicted DNA binding CopG/RHH family protein
MTRREKEMHFKPKEPIPEFKSREEEAEFWDTHDVADYWDKFKPVRVKFAKNPSQGITVRFDKDTLDTVRAQAQERGVGPTTLVRMWILERLRSQRIAS